VAVLGCGPIGLFVVQLARLSGAQEVFATDVLDHRLEMARRCGASMVINPTRQGPVSAILEATHGRGVDVTFEVAGALETPEQGAEMTTACGTVVVIGICSEDQIPLRATPARR
jgi:L-iditol 2-dehydrogenase